MSEAELLYQSRFRVADEMFQHENKQACFDICNKALQDCNVPQIYQARAHYYLSASTSDRLYHAQEAVKIYEAMIIECRTVATYSKIFRSFKTAKARLVKLVLEENMEKGSTTQYDQGQNATKMDISNSNNLENPLEKFKCTILDSRMTNVLSEKDRAKSRDLANKIDHPIVRAAAQAFASQDYPTSFSLCHKVLQEPNVVRSVQAMVDELLGRIAYITAAPHLHAQGLYPPIEEGLFHAQQAVDYYKGLQKDLPADDMVKQILKRGETVLDNVQKLVDENIVKNSKDFFQRRVREAQSAYNAQNWSDAITIAQDLLGQSLPDAITNAKAHTIIAAVSMTEVTADRVSLVSRRRGLWHAQRAVLICEESIIVSPADRTTIMSMKAAKIVLAVLQEEEKKYKAEYTRGTKTPATENKASEASHDTDESKTGFPFKTDQAMATVAKMVDAPLSKRQVEEWKHVRYRFPKAQGKEVDDNERLDHAEVPQEETNEAIQGNDGKNDDWIMLEEEETSKDGEAAAGAASCILM